MVKKQVQKTRVKKKKWFSIVAPKLFNEIVIGEIPLVESEPMVGRSVTVNMMNLTGNPRRQHNNVVLRITKIGDGKGITEVTGFKMMPSSVKRLIRRGRSKVDDSIVVATKDNKKVRIKPLLLTRTNVNNSVTNSIRIKLRNTIAVFASKVTYEGLVNEILGFKLQKHLDEVAKKVCPTKGSEIRAFSLVEKEGIKVIKPVPEKERSKKSSKKKIEELDDETGEKTEKEEKPDSKESKTPIKAKEKDDSKEEKPEESEKQD